MTPADVALLDQVLAEFSGEVDRLLYVHRKLAEGHGREQASADLCALLNTFSPQQVAATRAAAILRLADMDGE